MPITDHPPHRRDEFARRLAPLAVRLVGFARRLAYDPADAEDILQAALTSAWTRFREGVSVERFDAWLARFLVWEAANLNRSHQRARRPSAPVSEERDLAAELSIELAYTRWREEPGRLLDRLDERLVAGLDRLGASEREAFLLKTFFDLSCREIAAIQEVPQGTVMARLLRARCKLRESLVTPLHKKISAQGGGA